MFPDNGFVGQMELHTAAPYAGTFNVRNKLAAEHKLCPFAINSNI